MRRTGVSDSENNGPAPTPTGDRLDFGSQPIPGTTSEVTDPFIPVGVPAMGMSGSSLLAAALGATAFLAAYSRKS